MGERTVETCDIFDTLQPKGLRTIRVVVEDLTESLSSPECLSDERVAVGERGKKRVIRIAQNATKPYASTRKATKGKAAGDA